MADGLKSMSDKKALLQQARQLVEQEMAWSRELYASAAREPLSVGRNDPAKTTVPLSPAPHAPGSTSSGKAAALKVLYEKYNTCARCSLGLSRLKFVFGVGNPDTPVLLIGEGPGYQEDHKGEPFVGRSGQLLDKMMEAIGFSRQSIYIANIVKCHPMINPKDPESHGNDRPPTPEEVAACSPILQQQIAIIQPKVILTLGSPSTKAMLGTAEGISKVRGKLYPMPMAYFKVKTKESDLFGENKEDFNGFKPEELKPLSAIRILPTYHPAALLRNPNLKKDAWEDLKLLKKTIEAA
jgi:uracil-DNA glycosylase family 4